MKMFTAPFKFSIAQRIRHLPGTLLVADYRRLLEALEVEDSTSFADDEIEEVAVMALQDLEHQEALSIILDTLFKGQFTAGQVQNLTEELKEESCWDEYSDLADHRTLYICCDLMHAAFPTEYPEPALMHLQLTVHAEGLDSILERHPLNSATLLRAIARTDEERCRLSRLFSEQLKSDDFPEADWLLWLMEAEKTAADQRVISCYGSEYWFNDIEEGMDTVLEIPC